MDFFRKSKGKKKEKRPRTDGSEDSSGSSNPTPINVEIPPHMNLGIIFETAEQENTYHQIFQKDYFNTKFVDSDALKSLHMKNEILRLFKNIGWEKLLTLSQVEAYHRPTIEFLSSLTLGPQDAYIDFRAYNVNRRMSLDVLCSIVHTADPNNRQYRATHQDFSAKSFWLAISNEGDYKAGKAKASRIVHPVLKLAHRIISCVIFPSENPGVVIQKHLELLWLMTRDNPVKPHFGWWIARNLLSATTGRTNQIHYGGIIAHILRKANVQIQQPETALPGGGLLNMTTLSTVMALFETTRDGQIWTVGVGGRNTMQYLSITPATKSVLKLPSQLSRMNWKLPSNISTSAGVGSSSQRMPQSPQHSESYHSEPSYHTPPPSQPSFEPERHSTAAIPSYFTDFQTAQNRRWDDLDLYHRQQETIQNQRWSTYLTHYEQQQLHHQQTLAQQQQIDELTRQFSARSIRDDRMERMIAHMYGHDMFSPRPPSPPHQ